MDSTDSKQTAVRLASIKTVNEMSKIRLAVSPYFALFKISKVLCLLNIILNQLKRVPNCFRL